MVTTLTERIENYIEEHEIDKKEFVRRMGYENINKGLRRLHGWMAGGLQEKKYPGTGEQIEGLARVLPASKIEIKQLISWEKQARKLEQLEKRRQDDRYFCSIRTTKFTSGTRTFPGDRDEQEVIGEVREIIARKMEDDFRARSNYFRCELNTPDCKSYHFNKEGEITRTSEATPGAAVFGWEVNGHSFTFVE